MKQIATIFGIMILSVALTAPVFAYLAGGGGRGLGNCWQESGQFNDLTEDQRAALAKLEDQFYQDTTELRREIWSKSAELDRTMSVLEPDANKARVLQKEISELKAKMSEKKIGLELAANKIAPDGRCARRHGRGYIQHMRGCGRHDRGFGTGTCWD